jgi:uncharacterized protein
MSGGRNTVVQNIRGNGNKKPERVQVVDALRGFALLGMLLVHFQYYVRDDGVWSQRANSAIEFLAVNRFYPLFALLFGVGFALQFERWGERHGFLLMYLRRIAALLLFATAIIFVTGYSVLESYAFWALPLLMVRQWSNRALLAVALLCALGASARQFVTWEWERHHLTLAQSNAAATQETRFWPDYLQEEARIRKEGTFWESGANRLHYFFGAYGRWQSYVPGDPLMLFILGVLAVRLRVFQDPARNRKLLKALIVYGVAAGVISTIIFRYIRFDLASLRLGMLCRTLVFAVFDERFQGLAYAAALLLWIARSGTQHGVLALVASPGRLSLTNYVMQIAILEGLFASNALNLPLNRWCAIVGVCVVFAAQIAVSRWWMVRYRYGPLEWIWRSITFARMEPLRREPAIPLGGT